MHCLKSKHISKGLEFVNMSKILENPDIQNILPSYFDNTKTG